MTPDLVRISKTLSLWLRHKPQAAGLSLDAQGWAMTDAVLAALGRTGLPDDWQTLLEVVEHNDKQRFQLSPDGERVRARQGHSIEVEGEWAPPTPPDRLYHGTVERFLEAIRAEGLKPMRRHHVHLSPDRETAEKVGRRRGAPVILTVDARAMAEAGHGFWLTGNGVWLAEHVPAAFLGEPG
jgi:putative RNA 2'-phosphotransferase